MLHILNIIQRSTTTPHTATHNAQNTTPHQTSSNTYTTQHNTCHNNSIISQQSKPKHNNTHTTKRNAAQRNNKSQQSAQHSINTRKRHQPQHRKSADRNLCNTQRTTSKPRQKKINRNNPKIEAEVINKVVLPDPSRRYSQGHRESTGASATAIREARRTALNQSVRVLPSGPWSPDCDSLAD